MGEKQHYIPRLLLKGFSSDSNGKTIVVHYLKEDKFIAGAGLYDQAHGRNLYGTDQLLEKSFETIETLSAAAIRKIRALDINLPLEEQEYLKYFVVFQRNRTPNAMKDYEENMEKQIKHFGSHLKKVAPHLDKFRVKLTHPYHELFLLARDYYVSISDLKIAILHNTSDLPFVIGEHPVVILNPFLELRGWKGSKLGLALKGACIVLPISSDVGLLLFDRTHYRLIGPNNIALVDEHDARVLNECQYLQTGDCVYMRSTENQELCRTLNNSSIQYRETEKTTLKVSEHTEIRGKEKIKGEIIESSNIGLPLKEDFHFLGVLFSVLSEPIGPTLWDLVREGIREELDENREMRCQRGHK